MRSKKIKYVVLGDSMSAGTSAWFPEEHQGYSYQDEEGKTIFKGMNYPTFLAQFINEIEAERITYYKNYALGGSATKSWVTFLKGESETLVPWITKEKMPYQRSALLKDLEEANLITISLGGNDFWQANFNPHFDYDFKKMINSLGKISGDYRNKWHASFEALFQELNNLFKILRDLNKDAKIVFMALPMPFMRLRFAFDELVNQYLPQKPVDFSFIDFLCKQINRVIINFCQENQGCHYISFIDVDDFEKNTYIFSNALFNIHPSEYGHKYLALNYLKSIFQDTAWKEFLWPNLAKSFSWNKFVFINSQPRYLLAEKRIQEYLPFRSREYYYQNITKMLQGDDLIIKESFLHFCQENFLWKWQWKKIEPLWDELAAFFLKSIEAQKYLQSIQENLENWQDKITLRIFKYTLYNEFSKLDFLELVKFIFQEASFSKDQEKLLILKDSIQDFLNGIFKFLGLYNRHVLKKENSFEYREFKLLIKGALEYLFDNSEKLLKATSFNSLLAKILKEKYDLWASYLNLYLKDALKPSFFSVGDTVSEKFASYDVLLKIKNTISSNLASVYDYGNQKLKDFSSRKSVTPSTIIVFIHKMNDFLVDPLSENFQIALKKTMAFFKNILS